mmetsp:Transcript_10053/g.18959  ORF Transcript_10053/g.18959 Transcript_10053/m.18959 type:complete len:415 (-) Transcript_10053:346-1590(-)
MFPEKLDKVWRHRCQVSREVSNRFTRFLLPSRPPDPVSVLLQGGRKVIQDHVPQSRNVYPSSCNVRGHKRVHLAALEILHGANPLLLVPLPVNHHAPLLVLLQESKQVAAFLDRVDEYQYLRDVSDPFFLRVRSHRLQVFQELPALLVLRAHLHHLLDVLAHGRHVKLRLHVNHLLIPQPQLASLLQLSRESRAEQQGLHATAPPLPLSQLLLNFLKLFVEPHLKHLIRLVYHEKLHLRQVDLLVVDEVAKPPWCCDDDTVLLRLHRVELFVLGDPAGHCQAPLPGQVPQVPARRENLLRKLPRWSQNQRPRLHFFLFLHFFLVFHCLRVCLGLSLVIEEIEYGEHVSECFSGAWFCPCLDVVSFKAHGPTLPLNFSRLVLTTTVFNTQPILKVTQKNEVSLRIIHSVGRLNVK